MKERVTAGVVALALALVMVAGAALALAGSISRHRRFQVDEIEHVHVAYSMRQGALVYADFWEGHNPLLWFFLMPVIDGDDAVASFLGSRVVMAFFWIGIVVASAVAAFRRGGWWAATAAALLLLLHSTFVERGIEVRPDGPLASMVMAALAVELSGLPRFRRFVIEALILSAGFLFTQKGVFFCVAFGLWWSWFALRERRVRLAAVPTLVWAMPVVLMIAVLASLGNLDSYLRTNVYDAGRHVARATEYGVDFGAWTGVLIEGARNRFFLVAAAAALLYSAARLLRERAATAAGEGRGPILMVSIGALVYLWANPFPFPYLHVAVIPPLAVLIAVSLADAMRCVSAMPGGRFYQVGALALIAALASIDSFPRMARVAGDRMDGQMATLAEVQRITGPEDTVFDLTGLYFRRDAYPVFVMTGNMLRKYQLGGFPPIVPYLRRNAPAVIMANYRTANLPREEIEFFSAHYVPYAGSIHVPGSAIDARRGATGFEVLKRARFRYRGTGSIRVDGEPFVEGALEAGLHRVDAGSAETRGRIELATPPPFPDPGALPVNLYTGFD